MKIKKDGLIYTVRLDKDRISVSVDSESGGGSFYFFYLSMLDYYIKEEKNEILNSIFINLDRQLKLNSILL